MTIAGESAGGYSVCALLGSPPVRGLFQRAVIQSGSCIGTPLADAEASRHRLRHRRRLPRPATAAACLRAKTPGELLDNPDYPGSAAPTWGGHELPRAPAAALAAGRIAHVPVLVGTNHDEGRTFAQGLADLSEPQYEDFVRGQFGAHADAVLAHYPWSAYPSPYTAAYAIGAIWTDSGSIGGIGGCGTQALAHQLARGDADLPLPVRRPQRPGPEPRPPGLPVGRGPRDGARLPVAELRQRLPAATRCSRPPSCSCRTRWCATGARSPAPAPRRCRPAGLAAVLDGELLSLRPGGETTAITDAEYGDEHQCDVWDALSG